jgi:large conductance mechanosensitive channel
MFPAYCREICRRVNIGSCTQHEQFWAAAFLIYITALLTSMSIVSEFKEFISKGNVLDLAVGVIIGAAFSKIVSSLTDDILMPVLGLVVGKVDYSTIVIGPMKVGSFINAVLNFFIIAFCIFLVVKAANKFKRPAPVVEVVAPVVTKDQELLAEIRDALQARK